MTERRLEDVQPRGRACTLNGMGRPSSDLCRDKVAVTLWMELEIGSQQQTFIYRWPKDSFGLCCRQQG